MNPDDINLRGAPRFVPTLTEVVDTSSAPEPDLQPPAAADNLAPAPVPASLATPLPAPGRAAMPGPEVVAALLLQRLDLDQQISETIARVLHEQMLGLNARVHKAVAEVVREAVAKALAQGMPAADDGKNP